MFIGQEKLLSRINDLTIDQFPKSSLLLGKVGCGKHTIAKMISDRFNMPLVDITDNISLETIMDIYERPVFAIYLIDTSKLTVRHQNIILKLLEEPLKNSYLILLCEDKTNLLPTVINRCFIFEFDSYTKEQLLQFVESDAENVLNICETPGQIKTLGKVDLKSLLELCNKIVDSIQLASLNNTLTISNKLNFKDEFDKFDINLFFNTLTYLLAQKVINEQQCDKYLEMYHITCDYKNKLKNRMFNRQYIVDSYLSELWVSVRKYAK